MPLVTRVNLSTIWSIFQHKTMTSERKGFPGASTGKDSAMQETWVQSRVGKTPWRRERLSTSVFWPEEFHGLYNPWGHKELDTTERLSLSLWSFGFSFYPLFEFQQRALKGPLAKPRLTREALNYSRVLPIIAENNWPRSLRTRNVLTQMPSFILLEIKAFCKTGRCNFQAGSYPVIFSTLRSRT